jgi:acyl CoA:acetate/3-ketoacid CoA transferase alpha subunit
MTIMLGGFGPSGIPENAIAELVTKNQHLLPTEGATKTHKDTDNFLVTVG